MFLFVLCLYECPVGGGQKGMLDPKKLELHLVVSYPIPVLQKSKKFPYPPSPLSSSWLAILFFMAMVLQTRILYKADTCSTTATSTLLIL